jgi:hypothetical protein
MVTAFLGQPESKIVAADHGLQIANIGIEQYRASMRDIIDALEAARFECAMDLRPTSNHTQFERLEIFIGRAREASYKIIAAIGDPGRDFEPIAKASELLDVLASHIVLRKHLENLAGQPTSIGADLKELRTSMREIISALDSFRTETSIVFERLMR